jgi:hypothetical protein
MTVAGRQYMTFLAAFNTGDPEAMLDYIESHFDPFSFDDGFQDDFIDWYKATYAETGGMTVHRTYLSEEYFIIVITKSRQGKQVYLDKLAVTSDAPHLITEYNHVAQAQA